MTTIDIETAWIGSLALDRKLRFLARLSFEITIAGRNSYEAGTDELTNPRQLRQVNEIQHRVTACLSQLLTGACPDGFEQSIAKWVLAEPDAELKHILQWCWIEAKTRVQVD
jgi:hypothetical protein